MTCVGTRRESRVSIVARFERVASSRVTSHLVSFTTTPMNIPWIGIDRNTTYKCADRVKNTLPRNLVLAVLVKNAFLPRDCFLPLITLELWELKGCEI
jgi:hypothetical protein